MTTEGKDKVGKPSFFKRLGGKKSNQKSSNDSTVTESTHVGDAPEEKRKMSKLASYHIGIQKVTSDYLKVKAEKGGCGC
ncbi:predicted protein [Chaetoceros tenuissimus]|uniref:Uncharacterized protein n=1 Tax=Chaetoceros tenuissimus TaxID=426638 RepID=A0AAD3HEQ2_9STRA|nr:predicted protein [Chaetoceros tenuissimus]